MRGEESFAFDIGPYESVGVTAKHLEEGMDTFDSGQFGDGKGKWRLLIVSSGRVWVSSMMETPTGHLTNLSTVNALLPEGAATSAAPQAELDLLKSQFGELELEFGVGGEEIAAPLSRMEPGEARVWESRVQSSGH